MIQDQPGSCAEPRADLPLAPADDRVPGAPARPAGPPAPGPPRPCRPCTDAAVGVRVMAPRRAAAGLAAAQMVQLMAAGACACGDCVRSRGLDGFRPGTAHGGETGSMPGRRMPPHSGGGDLDRGAGGCAGRCPGRSRRRRLLRSAGTRELMAQVRGAWPRLDEAGQRRWPGCHIPCGQPLVPTGLLEALSGFFRIISL